MERIFPLLHLADLAEEVLHLTEMVKLTLAVAVADTVEMADLEKF